MPGVQKRVDLNAPVQRFSVSDRVTFMAGNDRTRRGGVVAKVFEFDSIYVTGTGDGFTPWGTYLGRSTYVTCEHDDCWCNRPTVHDGITQVYHSCNECQLAPDTRAAVSVTLF